MLDLYKVWWIVVVFVWARWTLWWECGLVLLYGWEVKKRWIGKSCCWLCFHAGRPVFYVQWLNSFEGVMWLLVRRNLCEAVKGGLSIKEIDRVCVWRLVVHGGGPAPSLCWFIFAGWFLWWYIVCHGGVSKTRKWSFNGIKKMSWRGHGCSECCSCMKVLWFDKERKRKFVEYGKKKEHVYSIYFRFHPFLLSKVLRFIFVIWRERERERFKGGVRLVFFPLIFSTLAFIVKFRVIHIFICPNYPFLDLII